MFHSTNFSKVTKDVSVYRPSSAVMKDCRLTLLFVPDEEDLQMKTCRMYVRTSLKFIL